MFCGVTSEAILLLCPIKRTSGLYGLIVFYEYIDSSVIKEIDCIPLNELIGLLA